MPIPFLNSITLNKNEIQEFKVYNLTPDPTLTSGGDYGYMWLNTSDSPKTLKWWDGTSIRSIVDSGNTSTLTVGTANDLSGGVAGSLPYQQGAGDTTFLGIGTANQVLTVNSGATAPQWLSQSSLSVGSATTATTATTATNVAGGANGSILVQSGAGTTGQLAIGANGYILTSNGTTPGWSASIPSTSVSGLAASATTDTTNASNISSGTLGLARLSLATGQFYVGDASSNPAATAKSSIPLSGFGNAAADINIGGFKITNSGTIGSGDADSTVATKGYVDSVAQGLDVKASCLVATTADITLASPGAVTIDGIYSATDFTAGTTRILVKDQSAPAENGIYIWQGPSSAMTRSSDANTWDELVGAFTFVERGTANADSGWVCTVNAGGTLGSTAVTWVKFSQAGSYTAGNGIVQSGTSFNFAQSAAYTAGQIPFAGGTLGTSSTTIGFDSNFVWDDQANRLGIGTATPTNKLTIAAANSSGLNIAFDASGNAGTGLFAWTYGSSSAAIGGGVEYTASNQYTARSTHASFTDFASGECKWYANTGLTSGNTFAPSLLMTLNGTGLGVGVVPTVGKFEANIENGSSNSAYFRTTTYTSLHIVGTSAGGATGGSLLHFTTTGNKDWVIGQRTDAVYSSANSFFIRDNGGGATRLTIDSSGNVGIGTTTPTSVNANAKTLHVDGAANAAEIRVTNNTTGIASTDGGLLMMAAANLYLQNKENGPLLLGTNGTDRLIIDGSGNLGLGVTPKSWGSPFKAFQIGTWGSVSQDNNNGLIQFSNNVYSTTSSNHIYVGNYNATRYEQTLDGKHIWYNAPSGTAGNSFAWSQAMVLDASGNLGIGTTPNAQAKLDVAGNVWLSPTAAYSTAPSAYLGVMVYTNTGVQSWAGRIVAGKANATAGDVNGYLAFQTNSSADGIAERLRIKSTGQLNFVGLASDPAGAVGDVVYNSTSNRLKYHNGTAWVNTGTNKYSGALAGTGTSFTVTHNLGTRDVTVAVRKSGSTYDQVFTDVQMTDTNTVTIIFASSVTGSDYTVTVIG